MTFFLIRHVCQNGTYVLDQQHIDNFVKEKRQGGKELREERTGGKGE